MLGRSESHLNILGGYFMVFPSGYEYVVLSHMISKPGLPIKWHRMMTWWSGAPCCIGMRYSSQLWCVVWVCNFHVSSYSYPLWKQNVVIVVLMFLIWASVAGGYSTGLWNWSVCVGNASLASRPKIGRKEASNTAWKRTRRVKLNMFYRQDWG